MKKIITLLCLIFISTVITAQVDSTTAFSAGESVANIVMDAIGAPTPIKIILHTVAAVIFGWVWSKTHSKKKAEKQAK